MIAYTNNMLDCIPSTALGASPGLKPWGTRWGTAQQNGWPLCTQDLEPIFKATERHRC